MLSNPVIPAGLSYVEYGVALVKTEAIAKQDAWIFSFISALYHKNRILCLSHHFLRDRAQEHLLDIALAVRPHHNDI